MVKKTPFHQFLSVIAVFLAYSLITLLSYWFFCRQQSLPTNSSVNSLFPTLPPAISPNPKLDTLGLVLLGYGGPGHQGGYLTDVIQVVFFDFSAKKIALISLPRDLYLKFPDGVNRKINAVFAAKTKDTPYPKEGLKADAAQAAFKDVKALVSGLTGLPIDYAIGIDFVGFERVIGGILEGITVNNPESLHDSWYPIKGEELNPCGLSPETVASLSATLSGFELEKQFPCRYETIDVPTGQQTLSGHQALAYVRSRHSSSDFSRSRRQHALLTALRSKLFSLKTLEDIPRWYTLFTHHLATDLNLDFIQKIAPNLLETQSFPVITINLSTDNVFVSSKSSSGAFILLPKAGENHFTAVHSYIQSQLALPPPSF